MRLCTRIEAGSGSRGVGNAKGYAKGSAKDWDAKGSKATPVGLGEVRLEVPGDGHAREAGPASGARESGGGDAGV
jgi:hypothetical protein